MSATSPSPAPRRLNDILYALYMRASQRAIEAAQNGHLEEHQVLPGDLVGYESEIEKGSDDGPCESVPTVGCGRRAVDTGERTQDDGQLLA